MPWFSPKNSKPDDKTIALWIGSIRSNSDREQFHLMLKQSQQTLMNGIAEEVLPLTGESDPEVAYLLVHHLSGRALLPSFKDVLDLYPGSGAKAAALYKLATESGLSDAMNDASIFTCSLEITNECKERHYAESLIIANHGIGLWPDVGELWRQRGVVKIALGDYGGASVDLKRAKELNPATLWLNEPLATVERLIPS
jgi:hypothetical protein